MDMTTNAVLLPVMHTVCPFCAISVMILSLTSWLVSLVVYKWIKSVFLFFLLAVPVFFRLHFILFFFPYVSLYACQKLKKYTVNPLTLLLTKDSLIICSMFNSLAKCDSSINLLF